MTALVVGCCIPSSHGSVSPFLPSPIFCKLHSLDAANISSFKGIDLDKIDNIGGSLQAQCYLSQNNEANGNHVDKISTQRNTYYKEALPLFEEMIKSCPNKYMFDEMCQLTRNRHMIQISSRGINNQLSNSKGMTLFGENDTNKRSMKRHICILKKWILV